MTLNIEEQQIFIIRINYLSMSKIKYKHPEPQNILEQDCSIKSMISPLHPELAGLDISMFLLFGSPVVLHAPKTKNELLPRA